ncbi:MAG: ABC transporter ATP-binding protein [Firmicutes bacterium]|nr:ABC transporter ATP-binding protein [Bacillota bacterium]
MTSSNSNNYVLDAARVSRVFGGLKAVDQVDFFVKKREIMSLIGPNGAGKTTLFNLFTGHYQPSRGEIFFKEEKINGLKPYQITAKGLARTFQNIRLFSKMSVLDNVLIGRHTKTSSGVIGAVLRRAKDKQEEANAREMAMSLLKFVGLEDKKDEQASSLSYGEQRRLEVARALAADPELLLLDEPAAGMNPQETNDLMELISKIRDEMNKTILLIEHDMKVVMGISERIAVLNYGKKIAEGTPSEILKNEDVIHAYLGVAN